MQIPSNGSEAMKRATVRAEVRLETALDDPEQGLVGPAVSCQRALGPAMRPSVASSTMLGDDDGRNRLVERDRDIRAERLLDADRVLRA